MMNHWYDSASRSQCARTSRPLDMRRAYVPRRCPRPRDIPELAQATLKLPDLGPGCTSEWSASVVVVEPVWQCGGALSM